MALHRWLSSRLHDVLGFSSTSIADMLIDCAQSTPSLMSYKELLSTNGIDSQLEGLSEELFNKIHANSSNSMLSSYSTPNDTIKLAYSVNSLEECSPNVIADFATNTPIGTHYQDDTVIIPPSAANHPDLLDPQKRHDIERALDIEERDQLAQRMRHKEEKRRKIGNKREQNEENAMAPSSVIDLAVAARKGRNEKFRDNTEYIERLREEARRDYLKKRESDKLTLAEKSLEDKERIFREVKLTKFEKEDFKLKKGTFSLAKKAVEDRMNRGKIEAYVMPDSYDEDTEARLAVLSQNYQEEKKKPTSEQQLWEQHQAAAAIAKFGSRKGREKIGKRKEYDFLGEDGASIDFVALETHGALSDDDAAEWNLSKTERDARQKGKLESKRLHLQEERKMLPIYTYREELLKAIHDYPVLIVVGETGSGKTTQIPQYLYEVGYGKVGKIGCTQPRRVAAMAVAARVSEEMGITLGRQVGYSIRFEDCTSESTIIKYMTDGMLLREFLSEPDLSSYSTILVDEAHERTLHTDVLFGLVKDLARFKDDLKLIISSATLEAEKFSLYFDNAPIFRIPGRRYPVQIYYTKAPEANFIDAAVVTVLQIHLKQPLGDILVFFPGQQEIEEAQEELERRTKGKGTDLRELVILPIYSALPSDLQAKIFEPTAEGARKVVLATNIAETSITIHNIVYVIDSGFCKQNTYNPKTGMESLVTVPCSQASANQRAGRAGRVRPGHCFRLYTKFSFDKEMDAANVPEIQRTNLGNVVLSLKSLGIDDLINFDFMDAPPPESLIKALELLYALGALNDKGQLTKLGRRMAEFPIDPMFSKMVIQAEKHGCVDECVSICAMLNVGNTVFYRPKDKGLHADNARKNFFRPGGDHITLLNVYSQWENAGYSVSWCYENFIQFRSMKRARDVREQLIGLLDRVEVELTSNPTDNDGILKAVTSGFFTQGARLNKNGSYSTLKHPHTVDIHPQSSLFGQNVKVIVYTELVLTTKEYMRNASEIKPQWLVEVAPHFYKNQELELGAKLPKGTGTPQSRN
ncbi:putative pre-mRna-splicing factor ATP-dependent Rna helicase [Cardiosporidium cionae]|uniref:RNA helicase n=1 Tax=Cardiosporidium cionae TaxID=476202 RepID=A0ABQ7J8Z6_9APIC|nr:putative pre-mRna-splicing factor ATP-dependent Rna helicase [Cardiosporidium cionae]|eukprot:KAF8820441.1 putative pre-mRna-splicing factor ATP-dependent Rna helicase [Cardiosporidium cionae]